MRTRDSSRPRTELERSLTLLKVFLLASAAILCVGAFAISALLTRSLRSQALEDARVSLTQYVNGALHDRLVQDDKVTVANVDALVARDLRAPPDILSVKVWAPTGRSPGRTSSPSGSGSGSRSRATSPRRARRARPRRSSSRSVTMRTRRSRGSGIDKVVEVYAPILDDEDRSIGAYEIYADSAPARGDRRRP